METLILVTAILALVLSVIIYRLSLHPLAKYPGPLLGRITDCYSVYHCLKGDRYLDFMELHNRYGNIVRYGPNRLSFSTVGALQAIYGPQANTKKSHWYDNMTLFMKVASTHATTDKIEHSRKRRILAQALSDRMVHVYEDGFRNLLTAFLRRFSDPTSQTEGGWSTAFDMSEELMLLNFDSMGSFCFGESFGSLQNPRKADITEKTLEGFRGLNAIGHMPGLAWLKLDALAFRTSRAIKEYEDHAASIADRCIQKMDAKLRQGERLSCVFDILYATSERPDIEGFTLPELRSESTLLVTTGTDTVAGTLANILFHLLNHPQCIVQLTTEVRTTFSNIGEIYTGKALNSCKYLVACIDEGMRLSSIVGGCLMREVGPGGITVDGRVIPAGVDVGVPHHVIMRNSRYYDNPLEYQPERWMSAEDNADKVKAARAAFCPFGIGPTGCVGKAWALVEMKITLAQLLFRYDLQIIAQSDEGGLSAAQLLQLREEKSLDRFVITNKGPFVRFREAKVDGAVRGSM
ncbi:cytochrome P450 [Amniculicola lignicola CBS 123094]|uniref:Cytochrome P450 n=1 Tax=Amniculicola lignicola CBS 123094 TaxID=1392246 RepID=A0A6A5WL23_9PLEO|nr:cytochrome P450 [Amniculicola lignicola CBS 123094]